MTTEAGQEITIYSDHVEVKMPSGVVKAISIIDSKVALDKGLTVEAVESDPIFLPSNCFIFAKSIFNGIVQCYYPERKHKVKFDNTRGEGGKSEYNIIFPNVIITHTLVVDRDKWKRTDTKFFATDKRVGQLPLEPIKNENTAAHIWTLPMPNMYSGGAMCFGRNTLISAFDKNNLRGLDWFYKILYTSAYNSDLSVPSLKRGTNPVDWLDFLSTQDKYPYDYLKGYMDIGEKVTEEEEAF